VRPRYTALWWLVVVATVCVPLAIRAGIGAIPSNDDWSYLKSALVLHDSHHLALQGFAQMFLIGQLVAVQPFLWVLGSNVVTFAIFGAIAAIAWLWLSFVVGRRWVGDRCALLAITVVACWPALGLLSSSFMTDAPFAALCWAAVYCSIRAFEAQRRRYLVATFVLSLIGFTFREQAIAVPIAVAGFAALRASGARRFRLLAVGGAVGTAVVCAALEHLRRGLPHADVAPYGLSSLNVPGGLNEALRMAFTFGLALAPLVVRLVTRAGNRTRPPRRVMVTWIAVVGAGVALAIGEPHGVLAGNYISQRGGYPNAVVGTPPLAVHPVVWIVVQLLAVLSTALLAGEVARHARRSRTSRDRLRSVAPRRGIPLSFGLVLAALYVGLSMLGQQQYDRYLLPLLPVGALLLVERRAADPAPAIEPAAYRRARPVTAGLTAFLYLLGLTITMSTLVRDRAVWDAATRLTAAGVPATSINAGSDWNGLHASTPVDRAANDKENTAYVGDMWTRRFPQSNDCFLVTVSPEPAPTWRLVATASAAPFGFGSLTVYTYARADSRPLGAGTC
jgi:hypothetical protein